MAKGTIDLTTGKIEVPATLDGTQSLALASIGGEVAGTVEVSGPITGPATDGPWVLIGKLRASSIVLKAPAIAGSHLIRIKDGSAIVAQGALEVAAPAIRLCTVEEARLSEQIAIVWRGPGAAGDRLEIYDPVEERVVVQLPAKQSGLRLTSTRIRVPDRAGVFSVRYTNAQETVLMERDLTVVPTRLDAVALLAPSVVKPGRKFQVVWTGARRPNHVFRLIDTERNVELLRVQGEGDDQGPIEAIFRAPDVPGGRGRYAVQYLDPSDGQSIARQSKTLFYE